MRKIQTTATQPSGKHTISAIGDSFTLNYANGMIQADFWPHQLAKMLRAQGAIVRERNFGISGHTTANMVARMTCLTQFEVPDVCVIYGGVNDSGGATTVQASPTPTTTTFSVASGLGAKYGANAYITVNGVQAQIASVSGDAITLKSALGFTPSAGQAVAIDTQANLTALGNFVKAAGCSRILYLGQHYINTTGGTNDAHSTPRADYATLRGLQSAAAAAVGAAYASLWTYMDGLIQNATPVVFSQYQGGVLGTVTTSYTFTQGDGLWHFNDGSGTNFHLSAVGEYVIALAAAAAIQAQTGWLAAIS